MATSSAKVKTPFMHYPPCANGGTNGDDHKAASYLESEIKMFGNVKQILPVETNIVIFDLDDGSINAPNLVDEMEKKGFLMGAFGEKRIRLVTHLDVDMDASAKLIEALKEHLR